MCSIVEPWPDSMTRRIRSCCFSVATWPVVARSKMSSRLELAVAGPAGGVDQRQVVRSAISRVGKSSLALMPSSRVAGLRGVLEGVAADGRWAE